MRRIDTDIAYDVGSLVIRMKTASQSAGDFKNPRHFYPRQLELANRVEPGRRKAAALAAIRATPDLARHYSSAEVR